MRKLKASLLLGAFLSVAGVMAPSSFGTTIQTTPVTVPLEFSGQGTGFNLNPLAITPSVNVVPGQIISLTFQNVYFYYDQYLNLFTSTTDG